MTLKELMEVLPAYTTVSVHDDGSFACQGNPHSFVLGLYKSHENDIVKVAVPIAGYHMEITVERRDTTI